MRRRIFRLARITTPIVLSVLGLVVIAANRDGVVQAQRLEPVLVSVYSDGTQYSVRTAQTTVGSVLSELGIGIGPQDVVMPTTNVRPYLGMNITVVRVENAVEERNEPIAFDTVKTFTKNLRPGMTKQSKAGVPGKKLVSYQVRYKNGDEVNRKVISSKVIVKPVNRVVQIGSKGRYTSRGEYETHRVVRMNASAYDPGPRSCGPRSTGRTSIGLRAGYGVVAVDPRVIPLGSKLYIEGYGFAVAGDTGGAIKGRRIDLGFGTYREAIRFGRRSVRVHTLKKAVDK